MRWLLQQFQWSKCLEGFSISENSLFAGQISPLEQSLSKSLEELVKIFKKAKVLTQDESKAIPLLINDRYFRKALKTYIVLKKHVKGKHTEQTMKMFKYTAEIVANAKQDVGFFGGMSQRLRGQ